MKEDWWQSVTSRFRPTPKVAGIYMNPEKDIFDELDER